MKNSLMIGDLLSDQLTAHVLANRANVYTRLK